MLKLIRKLTTTLLLFSLASCFGLFDSGSDTVVDNYDVTWIDLHEHRALYKNEQLVPPYVFAVGHNSKYIFVKQHPLLLNSPQKIDKSVVNYYIIERTKSDLQDKPQFGPMTKDEFDKLCSDLGISEPQFDLSYPTNL